MPPEGEPLVWPSRSNWFKKWIDSGLKWEDGFTFGPRLYEPPLKPRAVELPPVSSGRTEPYSIASSTRTLPAKRFERAPVIDDAAFCARFARSGGLFHRGRTRGVCRRRVATQSVRRRCGVARSRNPLYRTLAHFWNDLLQRLHGDGLHHRRAQQITGWLYQALDHQQTVLTRWPANLSRRRRRRVLGSSMEFAGAVK